MLVAPPQFLLSQRQYAQRNLLFLDAIGSQQGYGELKIWLIRSIVMFTCWSIDHALHTIIVYHSSLTFSSLSPAIQHLTEFFQTTKYDAPACVNVCVWILWTCICGTRRWRHNGQRVTEREAAVCLPPSLIFFLSVDHMKRSQRKTKA